MPKFISSKMEIFAYLKSFFQRYRKPVIAVACVFGILLLLSLFHLISAPISKLKEWRNEGAEMESPEFVNGLDSLQRQIAFKKALLALPKKDSINLVLNVPDSSLSLFINGLSIYKVQLTEMQIDPLLKRLGQKDYWTQFSKPLQVDSSRATIVKEPIIEKTAPKTQEEFLASVSQPDSLVYEPTHIQLILENGLELFLSQEENSKKLDRRAKRQFFDSQRTNAISSLVTSVFTFETMEYRPQIYLAAPSAELTSIYRALPERPKVVIYYN